MNNLNLIDLITPLYNYYNENKNILTGTDALEVMWDIGSHLKKHIDKNNIPPHRLFREIYGKSEGEENIKQKSYITREFQGRCYRIHNIFRKKDDIRKKLPNLSKFILFREAMPFFDNKKYLLEGTDLKNLLNLLNSSKSPKEIFQQIRKLQKSKIGIKNPRTQRLPELSNDKEIFIAFYNYIFNLLKERNYKFVLDEINDIDKSYIQNLARNTNALTQEGLKFFEFNKAENIKQPWLDYSKTIAKLVSKANEKERRRFRRLILPERIARLSDMLYALISEESFMNFR